MRPLKQSEGEKRQAMGLFCLTDIGVRSRRRGGGRSWPSWMMRAKGPRSCGRGAEGASEPEASSCKLAGGHQYHRFTSAVGTGKSWTACSRSGFTQRSHREVGLQ